MKDLPEIKIEEWREIPGFEGLYSVSNLGRVRRDKEYRGTKAGSIKVASINAHGYPSVTLSKKAVLHTFRVHSLVAMCFLDKDVELPEVNHIDGDKTNNNLNNLEMVSRKGNVQHAMDHNLCPKGEKHGNAKLKDENIVFIRAAYERGEKICNLASKFSVDRNAIFCVIKRETWKHIK